MVIYNYLEPHQYGLRQSLKALIARFLRIEEKFKIFFYSDELPGKEVGDLLRRIVNAIGGPVQGDCRFLIATGLSSWRDLSVDHSQGLAPSSGTIISCQGKREFIDRISQILKDEKKSKRQRGKKRTSLVGVGKGMWSRA